MFNHYTLNMFSRGRRHTKLHLIWKQLLFFGELFLSALSSVTFCIGVPSSSSRIGDEAPASSASVQASCIWTAQASPLFSAGGDWHAVLIHTPAIAAPLTSRRPTLHKQSKQKVIFAAGSTTKACDSEPPYLWTYLLLPKETPFVTVGHVHMVMQLKHMGIKTFDKWSQQFTTRRLRGKIDR